MLNPLLVTYDITDHRKKALSLDGCHIEKAFLLLIWQREHFLVGVKMSSSRPVIVPE